MWQKKFKSICPVCDKPIEGLFYEKDGKVFIKKECPEHGEVNDIASSNKDIFIGKMGLAGDDCSQNCSIDKCGAGIFSCQNHISRRSPIVFIEVTPRCNMNCPICYIDASTKGSDIPFEDIKRMIQKVKESDPETHLVLIGGEPTIHKDFFKILDLVRDAGLMKRCYLATNGITLSDEKFCKKVYDAGIRWYYLAFDGVNKETCKKIRGSYRSYEASRKTIENLRKFKRAKIVLSVTMVRGLNEGELPEVIKFALDNSDVVRKVSVSVEVFCGRQEHPEKLVEKRITPECIESTVKKAFNMKAATAALVFYTRLLEFLKLAGLLSEDVWMYGMPHPMCGSSGFICRNEDGSIFSAIDMIIRNPDKNIYRYGAKITGLIHRMGNIKSGLSGIFLGKFLWKVMDLGFFVPAGFVITLFYIRPSFLIKVFSSAVKSVFGKKKMRDYLTGNSKVQLDYLVGADKYNFAWEKMPYCATHHYRIDPRTKKVVKMCGCFVIPFRSYAESCNTMG
ncbi:radical SAM protein [bacterium]|jgi:hypothetical protein|nr:radical SAM protein [bacterium]